MRNNTTRLMAFLLVAGLLLSAVGGALAQTASPTARDMMEQYMQVLQGKQEYTQCNLFDNTQRNAKFARSISDWYGYSFEKPLGFTKFCITDLDADGYPEMILSLSQDFGFELLRSEKGVVYGFPFVYRAMEDVTLEGDLYGSNGAADNLWYRVRFQANQMQQATVCETRSTNGGEPVHYLIGDQEVTKDDYDQYCATIMQQKRPLWLKLTPQNVTKVVSEF